MLNVADRELKKVTEVTITFDRPYHAFIPMKRTIKLVEDHYYIIKLSDFMLYPPANSLIVTNWNQGRVPTSRYYLVDVNRIVNNMVKINGIGYDINTNTNLDVHWEGWIPRSEMEVLKEA